MLTGGSLIQIQDGAHASVAVFKWTIFPHYSFRLKVLGSVVCWGWDEQDLEFEWNNKCNQLLCDTSKSDVTSFLYLVGYLISVAFDKLPLLKMPCWKNQHRFWCWSMLVFPGGYRSSSVLSSLRICWTNEAPKCWNFAFNFDIFKYSFHRLPDCSEGRERLQLVSWILCTNI